MRWIMLVLALAGCRTAEKKPAAADAGTSTVRRVEKKSAPENPFAPTDEVRTSTDTAVDRGGDLGVPSKLRCPKDTTMKTEALEGLLFGWCERDGDRVGPLRAHAKKRLRIAGAYDRDGRSGIWRFFDDQGREIQRDVYRGPYLHRTRFGPDAKIRFEAKTTYTAGGVLLNRRLPSLPATYYDERGTKRAVVHFLVSRRHGPAEYFDEKGRPVAKGTFIRNEPVPTWDDFDPHYELEIPGQDLYAPVLELELEDALDGVLE